MLREWVYFGALDQRLPEGGVDDPLKKAKNKAAATYDAAADHFDDEPLSFWDLVGNRTVANLKLPAGAKVLDVGCGTGASALPRWTVEQMGPEAAARVKSRQCRLAARKQN